MRKFPKEAIFAFDLDGTIVPTTIPGIAKFQKILKIIGLPPADEELIRLNWGKKFKEVVSTIIYSLGGNELMVEEFISLEHTMENEIYFDPNLPIVLDKLRNRYYLALITSRNQQSFNKLEKDMNFPPSAFFSFIQTLDAHHYSKPDPRVFTPLLRWAERIDVKPENITYFGDTVDYDWAAVKNCPGMNFVGVVSGASKASEFLAAGVTDLVNGVDGLTTYLEDNFLKKDLTTSIY